MLMTTFNAKPNVLPNLMWIMDRVFKFTNFGIVSILHQDFFIMSVSIMLLPTKYKGPFPNYRVNHHWPLNYILNNCCRVVNEGRKV